MDLIKEISEAKQRIENDILHTPLLYSPWLSEACKGKVYLKMESEQYTGSFKARGSLNKLKWLIEQQINTLPVTASTGNHGLGFARALSLLNMEGKIFLPQEAESSKVAAIESYGADIEFYDGDPYQTELHAKKKAEEEGWIYVSPYNDTQVIAGQGTIGVEILEELKNPDHILATVGGGGLISGIGSYIKDRNARTKITGCQPENSPEMSVSVKAGTYREVASKPTLSDGSAGGFEKDSITFPLCQKLVDEFILVSEEEIKEAIRAMFHRHRKIVEGSAAVAVASMLKEPQRFEEATTVIVICGANISAEKLKHIL